MFWNVQVGLKPEPTPSTATFNRSLPASGVSQLPPGTQIGVTNVTKFRATNAAQLQNETQNQVV
jgi:hypothetical protein